MNTEQSEWIHSVAGQQALLACYTKALDKKSNDILTLKDLNPSFVTEKQTEIIADHLVHIDVLNEFKDDRKRTFTRIR